MNLNCIFSDKKGLTLIELVFVMGIISILTALSLVIYLGERDKAVGIVVLHELSNFSMACKNFYIDGGSYEMGNGEIIEKGKKLPFYTLRKDMVIEVVSVNNKDPFSDGFIISGRIKNVKILFDVNSDSVLEDYSLDSIGKKFKLKAFFKYVFYVMGICGLILITLLGIVRVKMQNEK